MCLLWGAGAAGGNGSRQGLFRYLTADETAGYLAIMDLFSATPLTDPPPTPPPGSGPPGTRRPPSC